ncbi:hypothetical protein VTO42DRAFT_1278 [Malbranchea cinnamomea]
MPSTTTVESSVKKVRYREERLNKVMPSGPCERSSLATTLISELANRIENEYCPLTRWGEESYCLRCCIIS